MQAHHREGNDGTPHQRHVRTCEEAFGPQEEQPAHHRTASDHEPGSGSEPSPLHGGLQGITVPVQPHPVDFRADLGIEVRDEMPESPGAKAVPAPLLPS